MTFCRKYVLSPSSLHHCMHAHVRKIKKEKKKKRSRSRVQKASKAHLFHYLLRKPPIVMQQTQVLANKLGVMPSATNESPFLDCGQS